MKPSQHFQQKKDYYTPYFLYYTYYFESVSRILQLVTETYALQADIQPIFERYHAIASRRKLSLLSILALFFCIIRIISLLFVIILIIAQDRNGIWVCIHCRKLASLHIHHRGSSANSGVLNFKNLDKFSTPSNYTKFSNV
jgi:hypothetical protein